MLGFGATLGASVLVFQGLGGQPGLVFLLPVYMYLFVVALGTDYNILMISRLREEAKAGHPPRAAVVEAFKQSAPTIASAGLILAGSFATFLLASADLMQEMGTSVAIGVLLFQVGLESTVGELKRVGLPASLVALCGVLGAFIAAGGAIVSIF